jgi:hypothetical protein
LGAIAKDLKPVYSAPSEQAMTHLAGSLGKSESHEVVYQAAMQAWATRRTLRETLLENEAIRSITSLDELLTVGSRILPRSCQTQTLVDNVLAKTKARKAKEGTHG